MLEQEPDRYERQENIRRICDTINTAQEGLDLAFAAGTLSTTAGVAREDSVRYKERLTKEDAKKATIDAKAGLKRALEKANYLEKENFKLLKYWLKNDEDTSANTVMFFGRLRKEIKRSLKVTLDTIKHPESLGARKRERLVLPLYPSLPSATEVTVEDSNNKTLEWVNNNKEKAVKIDTEVAMSMNPPDYEQSEKIRKSISYNDQSGRASQHPSQDAPQHIIGTNLNL